MSADVDNLGSALKNLHKIKFVHLVFVFDICHTFFGDQCNIFQAPN